MNHGATSIGCMNTLGVVVIGRNEGERLHVCLGSVVGKTESIVYVDSGSTDDSVAFARSLGVDVVELDLSTPFTAARARNAGLERLLSLHPDLDYVQFVDGDCEVVDGWLATARATLDARADVAIVCGRCRERYPDRTIYNRLCEIEWDRPAGEVSECGGIAAVRIKPFNDVGQFNPSLVAGEEPELCCRLRLVGWKILRIPGEMVLHDAAMTRFSQLWRRTVRAGYAYAEGAWMHGRSPLRHYVRENIRIAAYGLLLPLLVLALLWPTRGLSFILAGVYPVAIIRLFFAFRERGTAKGYELLYAASCVLGRIPHAQGMLKFLWTRLTRRESTLIEYK